MKHLIIFMLFFQALAITAQQRTIAIETPSSDFVFRGIDNKLSVVVEGFACKDLLFNVINAAYKWSDCTLVIMPNDKALTCSVEIMDNSGNLIATRNLYIRQLPHPVPTIEGFGPGTKLISQETIRNATRLKLTNPELRNYGELPEWTILSFSMDIEPAAGIHLEFQNIGSDFSEKLSSALQNCTSNSKIIVSNIKTSDPSGKEVWLPDLQFLLE